MPSFASRAPFFQLLILDNYTIKVIFLRRIHFCQLYVVEHTYLTVTGRVMKDLQILHAEDRYDAASVALHMPMSLSCRSGT